MFFTTMLMLVMTNLAVLAITKRNGKYLMGVESKESPIKGQWRFLGGHVKPNESPLEGIIRELQEEANISVQVISKVCEVQGDYVNIPIHVYLAQYISGEPRARDGELGTLGWFSLQEMEGLNLSRLCRSILEKYRDQI